MGKNVCLDGLPMAKTDAIDKSEDGSSTVAESDCDLCHPMLRKHRSIAPEESSCLQKFKYAVSCPPHGKLGTAMTCLLVLAMLWGVLYAVSGDAVLPGGNIFSILTLLLLTQIGGWLVSLVHLPPLLGMLLVGIALRSVPGLSIVGANIDLGWSAFLRKTALVIILTRAGLGLDAKSLRHLSLMVLRLGVIPNLVEVSVVALVVRFFLGFPWLWGAMLGFIVSGVSPSVVVPCMLSLSDSGYGLDKGVPTLVMASLSVDNVISISGFGVFLGIIFSEGSIVWQILKGPIEVMIGLCYALFIGYASWYLPNQEQNQSIFRFMLILSSGMLSIFGSIKIGFGGAGPIACLGTAFVAGIGWKKKSCPHNMTMIYNQLNFVWQFFLPLLFGLIGTEIKISALNGSTVGFGLITLLISLTFRICTSYFCVLGGDLNLKERLFVALAWIPKATIQAAFGSTALDVARSIAGNSDIETPEEKLGKQVLTIAVLVILAAAPVGAVAIMMSAPRLLHKKAHEEVVTSEPEDENNKAENED